LNRSGRGLVAVLAACAAALVAAPAASAAVAMKISAPKGSDVLIEELTLKAKCDEACTLGLNRVQAMNFKGGQQQPATGEEKLKGSKRLKPGQTATFEVPLGPYVRSQIQSAAKSKQATVVQVVTNLNGVEGPYRSATLRTKGAPTAPAGQDDIVLAPKVKLRSGATRWRVSVSGVQTTKWHYDRSYAGADGCDSWARGDGEQTISFRSKKPVVVRYGKRLHLGGKKPEPELVGKHGSFENWRLDTDIARTSKVDHGATPECGEGGGGHCPGCGGGSGVPEECKAKATRDEFYAVLMLDDTRRLYANAGTSQPARLAECEMQPFRWAFGDLDVLHAFHGFGNPAQHGGGGKVIVILRNKRTDPLDEGGGFTTTSVRYTVTFRRI
jgi:hypothetical protein